MTEAEIKIIMNALSGHPILTTSEFANKVEKILKEYKEKDKVDNKGNIMSENIWRYSVNKGEAGGIVIANTKEKAEQKAKEMYEDYDSSENAENEITVWKAIMDDDYNKDYPNVLEIY